MNRDSISLAKPVSCHATHASAAVLRLDAILQPGNAGPDTHLATAVGQVPSKD
jgi:hypothetical protein